MKKQIVFVLAVVVIVPAVAGTTILALAGGQTRGESTTVRPVEIMDVLHNPDIGWCLYTHGWRPVENNTVNLTGDDAPLFDIVVLDFMWAHLEPENNVFNWKEMDAIIDYWAKRGKQYSMRICMSYYTLYYEKEFGFTSASWEQCDPPDWLFDELGCGYQEVTIKGHTLKRPNYYDPIFLKQHQEFLNALAVHYDKPNNKSAFMEIRSYGRWGEWWDRGFKWADSKQKHDTLAALIRQYPETLKHTPFCVAGYKDDTFSSLDDYMWKMAYDVSESLGVINRRDGFPKPFQSKNYYDQRLWRHWPRIPTIGEDNWQPWETWGLDQGNYSCFLNYHNNVANTWVFNQKYYNKVDEYRDNYEAGLKAGGLGYRFVITSATYNKQVSAGGEFRLDQTWLNRNVGRAYRVYPLKVYLINKDTGKEIWSAVDGKFDQTPWIKGQSYNVTSNFSISVDLPSGTYDLRIAMVDGTGAPRIALAIAGGDTQKRYRIGSVIVSN